jgi:hypothetical protein
MPHLRDRLGDRHGIRGTSGRGQRGVAYCRKERQAALSVLPCAERLRRSAVEIIDAWMQHPSAEFLADPVFDSLRRWAHGRLAGRRLPARSGGPRP